MSIEPKTERHALGHRMKRKEDPRFLQGKGRYVDDISLPGMLYAAIVRSPYSHAAIKGQVLGIFGTRDQGIPQPEVDKFDAALTEAKVPHEIYRYDAEHAFANPSNPIYDEKSAADAWTKVLAFLDKLQK